MIEVSIIEIQFNNFCFDVGHLTVMAICREVQMPQMTGTRLPERQRITQVRSTDGCGTSGKIRKKPSDPLAERLLKFAKKQTKKQKKRISIA